MRATLHDDRTVSVRNVPVLPPRPRRAPAPGATACTITGDIAWGGNWFFLVAEHGQRVAPDNIAKPSPTTPPASCRRRWRPKASPAPADGAEIDHIELFADDTNADSRNFVLCPGMAYDRSPCGTGTSAKLACLAADATLAPGAVWRQASVIGSVFEGSYTLADTPGHIIPTIRGQAWISAEATLLLDPTDPYRWGIRA